MFVMIEILLLPVSWWFGKSFANYFEYRKPRKFYALIFGVFMGIALFSMFATVRYFLGGWILDDQKLIIRVDWFSPLDPPAIFLYMFFGYNGAISFYSKRKP